MTLTEASELLAGNALWGFEDSDREKEAVAILIEEASKVKRLEAEVERLRVIVSDCGWTKGLY